MKKLYPISIYDTRFLETPEGAQFVQALSLEVRAPRAQLSPSPFAGVEVVIDLRGLSEESHSERHHILLSLPSARQKRQHAYRDVKCRLQGEARRARRRAARVSA